MKIMRATSTGAPNYLYSKIPSSLSKLIAKKRKSTNTCKQFIKSLQQDLISIDDTGYCSELGCAKSLPLKPTAKSYITYQIEHEEDTDEKNDAQKYLASVAYNIVSKRAGNEMPDKSYEIHKIDYTNKAELDKFDNRMILYMKDEKPVDILKTWITDVIQSTPVDAVKIRRRDVIETTLKEILTTLSEKYNMNDIIIIDLSCNLTDIAEDSKRADRYFIRNINKMLNVNASDNSSSDNSSSGKSKSKTRSKSRSKSKSKSKSKTQKHH
jgi:hypothetical protein